jgi:hypothetical protein
MPKRNDLTVSEEGKIWSKTKTAVDISKSIFGY